MGVHKEIWTGEVIKRFRAVPSFLDTITGRDELVGNGVIHLVDLGVDPEVLIDNNSYPINIVASDDDDVTIILKKLETENTPITDDELHAISYKKMAAKTIQHGDSLREKAGALALYLMAPQSNTSNTPILVATGADDGTGRLMLRPKDISDLKLAFDRQKIPAMGRHLVLSPEHVNDLINTSQTFEKQYADLREGKVLRLHGFTIHEFTETVYYDNTNTKKAFGSVVGATDRISSIAYYAPHIVKAAGYNGGGMNDMKMYYSEAGKNPEYRRSLIGFRTYFVCLPKTLKNIGAIVSPQS